jgi:cell division protein FtsN
VVQTPLRRVISVETAPAQPAVRVRVTQSTKSVATEAAPAATGGRLFVQVGSFGVPANADGASARLAGLGLPVARSNGRIGGKAVQVVLAGPFGSAAEAQAALRAARGAGFGDAFVR